MFHKRGQFQKGKDMRPLFSKCWVKEETIAGWVQQAGKIERRTTLYHTKGLLAQQMDHDDFRSWSV